MNPVVELARRLDNLLRLGTVAEIEYEPPRVRVQSGALLTNWLHWHTPRAGAARVWDPPTIGEQVLLVAPSGELTVAISIGAIYQNAFPAPSVDPELHHRVYPDGAVIEYHHGTHTLRALLPDGGHAHVKASGGIFLEGPVHIRGQVLVEGACQFVGASLTHNGVNVGFTHTHAGVMPGPSLTSPPVLIA